MQQQPHEIEYSFENDGMKVSFSFRLHGGNHFALADENQGRPDPEKPGLGKGDEPGGPTNGGPKPGLGRRRDRPTE